MKQNGICSGVIVAEWRVAKRGYNYESCFNYFYTDALNKCLFAKRMKWNELTKGT